jgi:hypothetical protein
MIMILLTLANLLLLHLGSFRDGLFGMGRRLDWEKRHYVIWAQRDLPALLIIIASLLIDFSLWPLQLAVIFSHTFHRQIYQLGERSAEKFRGPEELPAWWKKLMRIYRKIFWWA